MVSSLFKMSCPEYCSNEVISEYFLNDADEFTAQNLLCVAFQNDLQ
jgi:hypothetical protein